MSIFSIKCFAKKKQFHIFKSVTDFLHSSSFYREKRELRFCDAEKHTELKFNGWKRLMNPYRKGKLYIVCAILYTSNVSTLENCLMRYFERFLKIFENQQFSK